MNPIKSIRNQAVRAQAYLTWKNAQGKLAELQAQRDGLEAALNAAQAAMPTDKQIMTSKDPGKLLSVRAQKMLEVEQAQRLLQGVHSQMGMQYTIKNEAEKTYRGRAYYQAQNELQKAREDLARIQAVVEKNQKIIGENDAEVKLLSKAKDLEALIGDNPKDEDFTVVNIHGKLV